MSVWPRWLTFVILAVGFLSAAASGANAEVRTLKLYHLHTHEKAEIVYKRNGRWNVQRLQHIQQVRPLHMRARQVVQIQPRDVRLEQRRIQRHS